MCGGEGGIVVGLGETRERRREEGGGRDEELKKKRVARSCETQVIPKCCSYTRSPCFWCVCVCATQNSAIDFFFVCVAVFFFFIIFCSFFFFIKACQVFDKVKKKIKNKNEF